MSPDKERTLFEKWPHWFRDASDIRVSLMSFGFECDDGWYTIIRQLCERLEPLVAALGKGASDFQIVQVKEKFGGLRFYVDGANDEINAAIKSACGLSVHTCEVCGNTGRLDPEADGWRKTLCDPCRTSLHPADVNGS